ncbi:hypothetical protein AVEN_197740-1 [Araneus ventricosus]|uniref:Uncharacterized protein n=1 Tax=Araneus ventricosus TaxID=182803 RepID=A0A4Y2CN79_ARAVE|nr:hypothetical protein AVEN_197740-1 [Araneus ventricosus]
MHSDFHDRRAFLKISRGIDFHSSSATFQSPSIVVVLCLERALFNRPKSQQSTGETSRDFAGICWKDLRPTAKSIASFTSDEVSLLLSIDFVLRLIVQSSLTTHMRSRQLGLEKSAKGPGSRPYSIEDKSDMRSVSWCGMESKKRDATHVSSWSLNLGLILRSSTPNSPHVG